MLNRTMCTQIALRTYDVMVPIYLSQRFLNVLLFSGRRLVDAWGLNQSIEIALRFLRFTFLRFTFLRIRFEKKIKKMEAEPKPTETETVPKVSLQR